MNWNPTKTVSVEPGLAQRPRLAVALSALVIAAVPAILIGNALWLLVNPWFVHAEYAVPGFPDDSAGLTDDERTDLAVAGIRSIRVGSDGVDLLGEARLPDGDPAFDQREMQHMSDVRSLVAGFLVLWGIALVVGAAALFGLRRTASRDSMRIALLRGAQVTIGLIALAGVVMLIDFEFFFDGFHGVFFEGESWQFDDEDTLRRLYPDFFWGVAGGAMAGVVMLQAAVLMVVSRRPGTRSSSRG